MFRKILIYMIMILIGVIGVVLSMPSDAEPSLLLLILSVTAIVVGIVGMILVVNNIRKSRLNDQS